MGSFGLVNICNSKPTNRHRRADCFPTFYDLFHVFGISSNGHFAVAFKVSKLCKRSALFLILVLAVFISSFLIVSLFWQKPPLMKTCRSHTFSNSTRFIWTDAHSVMSDCSETQECVCVFFFALHAGCCIIYCYSII